MGNDLHGYSGWCNDRGLQLTQQTASIAIATGWYDAFDAYFAATNGSQMNNMMGLGETYTYTQAIQGKQLQEAGGPGNESAITFAGNASMGDFSAAMETATWVTGEDASLTDMQGVLLLAGHCDAFPTSGYDYASVSADLANNPAFTTGVLQRAGIWGFLNPADINATIAMDFAFVTVLQEHSLKSTVVPMTIGMHSQLLSTPQLES